MGDLYLQMLIVAVMSDGLLPKGLTGDAPIHIAFCISLVVISDIKDFFKSLLFIISVTPWPSGH